MVWNMASLQFIGFAYRGQAADLKMVTHDNVFIM